MNRNKPKEPLAVGFVALGCPKNDVDSERMLAEIAQAGMVIVSDIEEADVIVVNTCGFIKPAIEESCQEIENAIKYKSSGSARKIIVAGCLAQRMGDELLEKFDAVDAVVGLGQRDEIAKIIKKSCDDNGKSALYLDAQPVSSDDRSRLLITSDHSTYLRISEGCDHKCTFCTIPSIRGPFRSKPIDMIMEEAKDLAAAGVKELNIIAQDTGFYGKDLKMRDGLAKVLGELETIKGIEWIRLLYIYPAGITDNLINLIKRSKKILPYFDMPIQHISDNILKTMKRPDTKERIVSLIEKIRQELPDSVLRTTFIVGFPGETDQDFEELLEFIKWARFEAMGAFKYYAEAGTAAAEMKGQIPEEIKDERLDRLMRTQQEIAFEKNLRMKGEKLVLLVDEVRESGVRVARWAGQAPEIDGLCYVLESNADTGDFITAEVVGHEEYDLIAKHID